MALFELGRIEDRTIVVGGTDAQMRQGAAFGVVRSVYEGLRWMWHSTYLPVPYADRYAGRRSEAEAQLLLRLAAMGDTEMPHKLEWVHEQGLFWLLGWSSERKLIRVGIVFPATDGGFEWAARAPVNGEDTKCFGTSSSLEEAKALVVTHVRLA